MKWNVPTLSVCLLIATVSCTKSQPAPLVPLSLGTGATSQAQQLNQRGTEAYQAREFIEAKSLFAQTMKAAPESGPAHYNFALALKAANYPLDAAQELKQIIAANGNETRAHLVLGNLWAEQWDDAVQARAHYLKVLELDPRHPQASAIRYWLVAHPP